MLDRIASRHAGLAALGALLLVLGLRFSLLQLYGSDLPFHDQWDAEALHLLRPWKDGADLAPSLFRFHNEHHPVLTKLIALGLTAASGMWSALPQLVVNTLLQGIIALLVIRLARRHLAPRAVWFVSVSTALLLSLPSLWENLLWGFQSQFYLCLLLGLLHLDLVWSQPRLGWRWGAGMLVGVLTLGTIAAGFLAVTAGGLVALTRLSHPGSERRHAWATLIVALAITGWGLLLINPVPYPAVAKNHFSAIEAFFVLARWPFTHGLATFVILLPAVLLFLGQALRAAIRPSQPWLLALVLWLAAVTAAFAFGRAEVLLGVTPRYRDILIVQCLVGLICLLQFTSAQSRWRQLAWLGTSLWIFAVGFGFYSEWRGTALAQDLKFRLTLQGELRQLVRHFVLNDDPAIFDSSPAAQFILGSSAQRVALLRHPGIRSLLPPSIRAPLTVNASTVASNVTRNPFKPEAAMTPGWTIVPDFKSDTRFVSDWITPEPFPLLRFRVKGGLNGTTHQLRLLVGPEAKPVEPLSLTRGLAVQSINFPMPQLPFRIEVNTEALSSVLSFSDPVALTQVDRYAGKLIALHLFFSMAGFVLLALTGLGAWRQPFCAAVSEAIPVSPERLRLLVGMAAVVLTLSAIFLWPQPWRLSASSRAGPLWDPTAWPVQQAENFKLHPVSPGDPVPEICLIDPSRPGTPTCFSTLVPAGDATTARCVSTPFPFTNRFMVMPMRGYPLRPGNQFALEILNDQREILETISFTGTNPGEQPKLWLLDLTSHQGRQGRLRCTDAYTNPGGWFAFAAPWFLADAPTGLSAWYRLADSNRLLWLRHLLLFTGFLCGAGWGWLHSRRKLPVPSIGVTPSP